MNILHAFDRFGTTLQSKPLVILLAPVISVLVSLKLSLLLLVILITLDFIYGVKKHCKQNDIKLKLFKISTWKTIQSKGLRATFNKVTEYGIGILVVAFFQALWFPNYQPLSYIGIEGGLTTVTVLVASLVEAWSLVENMLVIRPQSAFLAKIKGVLEGINNKIKNQINKI